MIVETVGAQICVVTAHGSEKEADHRLRQRYEDIARQIDREDQLVDKRTMWFLIFEGFVFSALAGVVAKTVELATSTSLPSTSIFCSRLSLIYISIVFSLLFAGLLLVSGILVAVSMSRETRYAFKQLRSLKAEYLLDEQMTEKFVRPFYFEGTGVDHLKRPVLRNDPAFKGRLFGRLNVVTIFVFVMLTVALVAFGVVWRSMAIDLCGTSALLSSDGTSNVRQRTATE